MKKLLLTSAVLLAGLAITLPERAEAKFSFEYNHPDLNWFTIETEHFFVHYPVSKKKEGNDHYIDATFMAQRTAKVSEEMWQPMCEQFDYYLTEKVHIVLLDQSDDLEGFTIPAWNWIEISGNPGGYFYRMRGRMEWFSDVLVHEFAHVVSLKRNAALAEGTGAVLIGGLGDNGRNDTALGAEISIQGAQEPFWWSEGGAEYWSDEAGYNWWTTARDANLRMTVLQDRVLTYDEWVGRADKRDWGDGERGYQQGYSFGLYLRERFGPDVYSKLSMTSGQRWRADWETIVGDVTGVPARQLYADWVEYLTAKYETQRDQVYADGLVEGREFEASGGEWEFHDPAGADNWYSRPEVKKDRRKKAQGEYERSLTGTWDFYPKQSEDGKWIGEHSALGGMSVAEYPESLFPAVAGQDPSSSSRLEGLRAEQTNTMFPTFGSNFGHGFDFVPGQQAFVASGNEDLVNHKLGTLSPEFDGYNWGQLFLVDYGTPDANPPGKNKVKHHDGKEAKESREWTTFLGSPTNWNERFKPIPNTLRAADPAVSPDGSKIAYLEYGDGTVELVVIGIDGSNKQYLTHWNDGTWMQGIDWSPDGSQLVFSMIRNFRQDLYVINTDGSNLHALNRDDWEDQDPFWAPDGSIYFSSDPDGIFNIYRFEPESGTVTQISNVIGGAECPWITKEGNLLYTAFTGFGWKNFIVAENEFLEKDVTGKFKFGPNDPTLQAAAQADIAYSEDLSQIIPAPKKYPKRAGSWMPPTAVPMFRIENDSLENWGLSAGGQIYAQDFVENHTAFIQGMLGEDPLIIGAYTYQGWYPNLTLFGYHYEAKFDYGFLLDDDDNPTTTDDQSTWNGKQNQYVNVARVEAQMPITGNLSASIGGGGFEFGFRGTDDSGYQPFLRGLSGNLLLHYSNMYSAYNAPNPRPGRTIDLTYEHAYTDIVYKPYNGFDTDDGMQLSAYQFNRGEIRWTEHLPSPFKGAKANQHRITLDGDIGLMDRNVSYQDEFRGGGTHPYYVGSGALQPNNQFAGYPGFSLSGETMIVLNAAYRFPLLRQINKRITNVWYLYDLTATVGGTTGNFWSYRIKDGAPYYFDSYGQHVAYDPKDVRREIPLLDVPYKNGQRLLFDANAEVRLSSMLFGENQWNSFVRLAYGFNEIKGIGDVNGDDIQDTTDNGLGDALSNETEQPGLRVYVGLGTGW